MNNIKAKRYIEYTKDGITDKFHEGDKVICRTVDEEYKGTITCVGEFKENEEAEPVTVILILLNLYGVIQVRLSRLMILSLCARISWQIWR